ncbi:MAG TPA: HAD family phosphatase [Sphingomicrobium sp.]|jgi:HAD superfamily hydrolase (TIGR01509 family)|nr:HAD family phosphatase [Sphingomicrobium sp.]
MLSFGAIIFDFDGVLLESEFEGNRQLAELLTDLGHRTSVDEAFKHYAGLSGPQFIDAIEVRIGAPLPPEFYPRQKAGAARALRDGIEAVVGAVDFVLALPPELPKAVASSSSTSWIRTHLAHLGLTQAFGDHVYSGREHVAHGKPAPDIYLHAADRLDVPIGGCVILEDSEIGATGALASGARVIGLAAGQHCLDGHADALRALGVEEVANSFDEVRDLLGLS